MTDREELLAHLNRIHTTVLGMERIKKNLGLKGNAVSEWCREQIASSDAIVVRQGKNWYVRVQGCLFTINASSFTIITAVKE